MKNKVQFSKILTILSFMMFVWTLYCGFSASFNQLYDISKVGFTVDEASKKEIYKTANAGIKPLEQYLKWITYGIGLAFLFLLMIILIIWLFI